MQFLDAPCHTVPNPLSNLDSRALAKEVDEHAALGERRHHLNKLLLSKKVKRINVYHEFSWALLALLQQISFSAPMPAPRRTRSAAHIRLGRRVLLVGR